MNRGQALLGHNPNRCLALLEPELVQPAGASISVTALLRVRGIGGHGIVTQPAVDGVVLAIAGVEGVLAPAWGAMFGLEMLTAGAAGYGFATPGARFATVVLQAPRLLPYGDQLDWLIPAANLVLLPAYFAASVAVERLVVRRLWRSEESGRVNRAVLFSNAASYLLLLLASIAWLLAPLPGSWPAA